MTPGTGGEVQEKTMPGFFFLSLFTSFSSPISFSDIAPNATHLNACGMVERSAALGEGSQTVDPATLVETKLNYLQISLSAWNRRVGCLHQLPTWGLPSHANREDHRDVGRV